MSQKQVISARLWHGMTRFVVGKDSTAALNNYQTIRNSTSRFHQHLTYSARIVNKHERWPLVKRELLKSGKPVTYSLEMEDTIKSRKFEFDTAALNARGFLRFQKAYQPPQNAQQTVLSISKECLNLQDKNEIEVMNYELKNSKQKFELLSKLFYEFQHTIPNSMLYMMESVGDIIMFYCTPINTSTPFEELCRSQDSLPPNLYIQKNPIRFHPDTDTVFGGQTAFTKSSTIVTGLRAKKKYRGYEAKMTWP